MLNGRCPKCSSTEIYVKTTALGGSQASVFVMAAVGEVFTIDCFLCLQCRYLEMYAADTGAALFGRGKKLADVVKADDKWEKVPGV
jgi:predicted nucleic-acid-binding Zn-ribbon protein